MKPALAILAVLAIAGVVYLSTRKRVEVIELPRGTGTAGAGVGFTVVEFRPRGTT